MPIRKTKQKYCYVDAIFLYKRKNQQVKSLHQHRNTKLSYDTTLLEKYQIFFADIEPSYACVNFYRLSIA